MIFLKYTLATFLICILFTSISIGEPIKNKIDYSADSTLQQQLDRYLSTLTQLKKFNGAVYFNANGKDILKKAYNLSSGPHNSLYVSNESQFDIHSVSKLMAYSILIQLQEAHQLKISDTISRYLPHFPNSHLITIDQLIHHSSGLPRELTNKSENLLALSPNEILAAAAKEKLEFTPGTDTRYSNIGYEVIYYLIQKITGKPFAQCVKEFIFIPLHMNASGAHFYTSHDNLKNLALNHQKSDGVIRQIPNLTQDEFPTARIYSTTGDLLLYLQSLHKEPFLSAMRNAQGVIEKNGGSDGIRTQIYTNTRQNYSFVLLSNYDEIPFQQTITDLVKIMERKPFKLPAAINHKAITIPAAILSRYIGQYEFAEANHALLEFRLQDGQLKLYRENKMQASLQAESKTVFFEKPESSTTFEFIPDGDSWVMVWTHQGIAFKGMKIKQ